MARNYRMDFGDLARRILEKTNNGDDLIDFARMVMDGVDEDGKRVPYPINARLQAMNFLADRCYGKPVSVVDVQSKVERDAEAASAGRVLNLEGLSKDELVAYRNLLAKVVDVRALPGGSGPGGGSGSGGGSGEHH